MRTEIQSVEGRSTYGRLLIVEDEPGLQKLLNKAAVRSGMSAVQCLDGEYALDVAASEQPDLILLDIMMPRSDGRDVLRRLKADPRTKDIPVFIYSARDEHYDRLVALQLGADDYFEKPFDLEMLMNRIEYSIWKRRQATESSH